MDLPNNKNISPGAEKLRKILHIDMVLNGELRIEELEGITRGQIEEILALSDPASLQIFAQDKGLVNIKNHDGLKAKVDEVTQAVIKMTPKDAFDLVKKWGRHAEIARQILNITREYLAVRSALTKLGIADLAKVELDKPFLDALRQTKYKDSVLPNYYDFTSRTDGAARLDEHLANLDSAEDPLKTTIEQTRYKDALLTEIIHSRLVHSTQDHIGTDTYEDRPITNLPIDSYEQTQKYSRPLPQKIASWGKNGVNNILFNDYGHLEFFDNVEKMQQVVEIILPKGSHDPAFQTYAAALTAFLNAREGQEEMRRELMLALHELHKQVYTAIMETFAECEENIHPQYELSARNLAIYALSTGEGLKNSQDWKNIHKLTKSGHIDHEKSLPLADSLTTLREISYREGIYLDPVKEELAERLGTSTGRHDTSPEEIAGIIERAYLEIQEGRDPHAPDLPGNLNWFITTVLFRTADSRTPMKADDGQARGYAAVHELIEYVRNFAT